MTAVVRPLYLEQGASYRLGLNWHRAQEVDGEIVPGDPYWTTDYDGVTARMQIRKTRTGDIVVDATTENGIITIGPDGRLDLYLSALVTDTITVNKGVYDLEVDISSITGYDNDVHRLLEGPALCDLNVTR